MVGATVIVGLVVSLVFPVIFSVKAATFTWLQTDWGGTQSTNTTANHTSNKTGWTGYHSASSSLSFGTEVVMTTATSSNSQTLDADFDAGTHSSTATLSDTVELSNIALVNPSLAGAYDTSAYPRDVYVVGDYAYLNNGGDLKIIDISTPTSPSLTGSLTLGYAVIGVFVVDNYAYVVDGSDGLMVVDISTPASPSLTGTYNTSGTARDVFVSGNYAYVADDVSGLQIIDISTPASPSLTGTYDTTGSAYNVFVSGDYAYVADRGSGLQIIDISTPASPSLTGTYDTTGSAEGVYVSGNYAYVADGASGLQIIDISTPASPSLTGTYDTTGSAEGVYVSGNYAYVADGASGLHTIDVSTPASPSLIGSYNTSGSSSETYVVGPYAYVADNASGLQVIQVKEYATFGTFTSSIIDTVANTSFAATSWTATVPGTGTLAVKIRTDSSNNMSGATAWGSCTAITSGNDITANGCVTDTDRYVQYQVTMTTTATSSTPVFNDIDILEDSYPTKQSFISTAFNTEDSANVIGDMSWTETLPAGTDIKFQLRTSSDGSTWTDWLGPTDGTDYHTTSAGSNSIVSTQTDGSSDQWIQYQATLTSDGSATPTLSDVSFVYVVNASPEFSQVPIVSQRTSDGYITIDYAVRDSDTDDVSAACQNCLLPTFQYSLDDGSSWTAITTGMSSGATATTTGIAQIAYATSSVTWNAKAQIDGTYSTTVKIRVTVDDKEGANNTASSTSATFTLDVKDPVVGSPDMVVIATTTPASIKLSATDDSALSTCITLDNTQTNCVAYTATSTISLVTDPDTVYVIYRDAYQNTTSASAATPETPANMVIRDVSNLSTTEYQEFIVWKAVSLPFQRYEIWLSTDGITYTFLNSETDRAINYYFHSSLSTSNTYYYKVYSVDGDGNTSVFSSVVEDIPNGQGGTDTTPPTISSITTSATTTQSATIVWDTDELANSTVNYGTATTTVDSSVGVVTMRDTSAGLGQHSVVVTGLSPNTTYYYSGTSADPGGVSATDTNSSSYYSFTTKSGPAISGTTESTVYNTGATIIWNTDIASDTYVVYSTNSDLSGSTEVGTADSETAHSYTLTGLSAGTTYYYYVKSDVATDNNSGNYYSFTTTSDTVAPVISVISEDVITDTAVVISWTTNEDSNSTIAYGTVSGTYTATSTDVGLTTSHSMAITSLATSTKYYYRVASTDASGNIGFGAEGDFTTLEALTEESAVVAREAVAGATGEATGAASVSCGGGSSRDATSPIIRNLAVAKDNSNNITVSWKTNELSTSFVEYGLTADFGKIQGGFDKTKEHEVTISDLQSNTNYYYRAVSQDESCNIVYSDVYEFDSGTAIDGIISTIEDLADNDEMFKAATVEALKILNKMSNEVSLESLEYAQNSFIKDFNYKIPAPILAGEPKVLTTATKANIVWHTDKNSNSFVALSPVSEYNIASGDTSYRQVVGNYDDFTKDHLVVVSDLEPDTTYHYQVRSATKLGAISKSRDFTFKTKTEELEITSYSIENISPEESVFKWATNIETDSLVKVTPYREGVLSVDEELSESDQSMTTIHSIGINQFESGVVYKVELMGTNINGQSVSKEISAFSTGDDNLPPAIYLVKTDSALSFGKTVKVQTIISWMTNEQSKGEVYYKKGIANSDTDDWEMLAPEKSYTKKHIAVITRFDPGSIYSFRINSTDSGGNVGISKIFTILTPRQTETVFQVIMKNIEDVFGWTKKLNGN